MKAALDPKHKNLESCNRTPRIMTSILSETLNPKPETLNPKPWLTLNLRGGDLALFSLGVAGGCSTGAAKVPRRFGFGLTV